MLLRSSGSSVKMLSDLRWRRDPEIPKLAISENKGIKHGKSSVAPGERWSVVHPYRPSNARKRKG
jgi:hypothetical protein